MRRTVAYLTPTAFLLATGSLVLAQSDLNLVLPVPGEARSIPSEIASTLDSSVTDLGSTVAAASDQQNKKIIELRRKFKEDDFPGHMNFHKPLSGIDVLPKAGLRHSAHHVGVYLLTCPRTKEQYVGKADGMDGFLGRWLEYVRTGHGGNIGLKSREPSDCFVSILEVAGSTVTEDGILAMESRWKLKLQSVQLGLNRNQLIPMTLNLSMQRSISASHA
jgi:hypothetical protein